MSGVTWGEHNGAHKIKDHQVRRLREEYAEGDVTQRTLAWRYGISEMQVRNIVNGRDRLAAGGPITHRGPGPLPVRRTSW